MGETANAYQDRFVSWLGQHQPQLGIDVNTKWVGTIVRPHILGVSYYLFFSPEWEMGLRWHVMIPPHDWAEIYLRRRDELSSTYAWRIPSMGDGKDPAYTPLPREGLFR